MVRSVRSGATAGCERDDATQWWKKRKKPCWRRWMGYIRTYSTGASWCGVAPCRRRRAVLIFVISSRGSGDTFVYCQNHRETLRRGYGKSTKKHRHGKVLQKRRDIMQPVFPAQRSSRTNSFRVIILYSAVVSGCILGVKEQEAERE